MRVLGLMSGTSADGIDAVLAEFLGPPNKPKWKLLNLASISYPDNLRRQIIAVSQGLKVSSSDWLDLAEVITELHAEAARDCDPKGSFEIIGCHGQTVWHRPPSKDRRGVSWQLIQAPLLAKLLQRPVVHDFRAADLLAHGHGAPLVPLPDEALLGRGQGWRGVLNLGGISNLTLIPPLRGPDSSTCVVGWDCGPGNSLIDLAMQRFSKGKFSCDVDGLIAARGSTHLPTIEKWLKEAFFQMPPPKSTGRDQFGNQDLENRLIDLESFSTPDIISTITTFTAAIIAQDLENYYSANLIRPFELLIAGGGSKNPVMIQEIERRCLGIAVKNIQEYGIPSQAREALAFGLLAWWNILKFPGNAPSVTGAERDLVLGIRVMPA